MMSLFHNLLTSVKDMGRHMRGEQVDGVRVVEVPEVDAPVAFDPENELYDPNDEAAVKAAWEAGTVTRRGRKPEPDKSGG